MRANEITERPPHQKFIVWFWTGDKVGRETAEALLEEGKTYEISTIYSARFDRGISPHSQDHLHGFAKGKEIFALNKDGSGHHTPVGTRIPKDVADWIETDFPNFTIPKNRIISEGQNYPSVIVNDAMIKEAYRLAEEDLEIDFD